MAGAGTRKAGAARFALAAIRIVNGTAGLVAPELVAGRLAGTAESRAGAIYPLRLFGVRTIAIGVELLARDPAARRRALDVGVLIHASDTAAALLGGIRGELPRGTAARLTLLSGLNTLLALTARRGAVRAAAERG